MLDRIEADRSDSQYDHITANKLWSYTCDIHNWSFAILFGCSTTTAYAFAYFLPIILMEGMGYSSRDAQLLSAPPTVFGAFFAFAMAAFGDWRRFCAPVIVFPALVTIIGLSMVYSLVHHSCTTHPHFFPTDRIPHKQLCSIRWGLSWCRWWYCQHTGYPQLFAKQYRGSIEACLRHRPRHWRRWYRRHYRLHYVPRSRCSWIPAWS